MSENDRSERASMDITSIRFSQCAQCRHKTLGAGTCTAFPDGIPLEILVNNIDHREYYPGDNGVRYEPAVPTGDFYA